MYTRGEDAFVRTKRRRGDSAGVPGHGSLQDDTVEQLNDAMLVGQPKPNPTVNAIVLAHESTESARPATNLPEEFVKFSSKTDFGPAPKAVVPLQPPENSRSFSVALSTPLTFPVAPGGSAVNVPFALPAFSIAAHLGLTDGEAR